MATVRKARIIQAVGGTVVGGLAIFFGFILKEHQDWKATTLHSLLFLFLFTPLLLTYNYVTGWIAVEKYRAMESLRGYERSER